MILTEATLAEVKSMVMNDEEVVKSMRRMTFLSLSLLGIILMAILLNDALIYILAGMNIFTAAGAYLSMKKWHESKLEIAIDIGVNVQVIYDLHGHSGIELLTRMCIDDFAKAQYSYDAEPSQKTKVHLEFTEWYLSLVRYWTRQLPDRQ